LRRPALASIRQTSYLRQVSFVTQLRQRDHHAALALVSEAAATNGSQPFHTSTIEGLLRLVPGDHAGYYEYEYCNGGLVGGALRNTYFVEQPVRSETSVWRSDAVAATISSWPLRDIAAGFEHAVKLSDFVSGPRLRRNPWYSDVMRPAGVEHECKVWLPAPSSCTVRGFFVVRDRGSRDFDERDLAALDLLRPHLARIRTRWEERRGSAGLTRREIEVLELVAQGQTNAEVAARLVISRATVRTHLENIFEKLGVHTRTAAAARLYDRSATNGNKRRVSA
jgi:DNA-binding CsgD family transcriptional regulator